MVYDLQQVMQFDRDVIQTVQLHGLVRRWERELELRVWVRRLVPPLPWAFIFPSF
jgi:hypothetical protein